MLQAANDSKIITLYSTLEPCLMCLGVAVMNKVNRVIYIQTDPHAGACGIDRKSLGVRYQEVWPEIMHVSFSQEPKDLIVRRLKQQIENGVRVEWSEKFLKLIGAK
jgi:tRNA(Arg) A34 adenosine deaminase TadA